MVLLLLLLLFRRHPGHAPRSSVPGTRGCVDPCEESDTEDRKDAGLGNSVFFSFFDEGSRIHIHTHKVGVRRLL
ncbi:hypothetical protein BGZ63DRAFT_394720 [Mariannaea sp. PMI_226]|nr:hypothetical protein BGZ63DRAFT_394720 [Mariannaea sp. PMI_226]